MYERPKLSLRCVRSYGFHSEQLSLLDSKVTLPSIENPQQISHAFFKKGL